MSSAAGDLCVYVGPTVNLDTTTTAQLFSGAAADAGGNDGAENSGFYVGANSGSSVDMVMRSRWAYTAN